MREPAPKMRQPVDPHWQRVKEVFQNRIKYRERELAELSQDYLELQKVLADYRRYVKRGVSAQARTDAGNLAAAGARDEA